MTTRVELLEREEELAALDQTIAAGAAGSGRLVAIRGQAGMGKTRLLEYARAAAADAGLRVLSARGSPLERSFAFGVVRQLFEALLARGDAAEREEILEGSAALALPVFEGHPQEPAAQPGGDGGLSVLHGLYWLAANVAERRPLLIAVDDLQWCDTPSLEWLGYLVRRLEGTPIVAAVTFRPAEVEADPVLVDELTDDPLSTLLRPSPLSVAAAGRLTEEVLGTAPDPEFTSACLAASGGNPLLLWELLEGLGAEGVAPVTTEVPRVQEIGPGAVSRSVRRRLSHLPRAAQSFARALAVLGDGTDLDLVAELAALSRETPPTLPGDSKRSRSSGALPRSPFCTRSFATPCIFTCRLSSDGRPTAAPPRCSTSITCRRNRRPPTCSSRRAPATSGPSECSGARRGTPSRGRLRRSPPCT